ncbi:endonuclease/exonuclease/phosphatase (EEP) superfamily protein YafD [Georgenia soli]|uniref:Endonuclease/exonuclease/phosphatase (EEP) superfamily protein YafD n=1 Tax=Georgenia soli TaxID=638953 RepID=A0A2A9EN13_9MICO|nr:endonuclease/exonuclease/phosphatase family protein [Georgenia soli]PFG39642.1 endonuclease/exonuclease/phosphatase (EEP) superfamily protein YafD [Georgenia soli]
MRVIGWLLVLLLGAAAVLTVNPEWLARVNPEWAGLTTTYPLVQVIALRPLLAALFAVVGVVVLIVGVVRKSWFSGGNKSFLLGAVLLGVAAAHAWYVWDRGLANPHELTADRGLREADAGDGTITVLTYNTLEGRTGADDVAALAEETGADVLVLNETSQLQAQQVATYLGADGETFQVFAASAGHEGAADAPTTTLLVSSAMGEYVQTDGPATERVSVRAEPASGVGPVLVGVHAMAPVHETHEAWLTDLEAIVGLCGPGGPDGLILAGDLNATLDHAPLQDLGRCVDAGVEAGLGGIATWPSRLPVFLGSTIDHVLVDPARYDVTAALVAERGRSDHRGVVVRLHPTSP